jgi:hypothetical protein
VNAQPPDSSGEREPFPAERYETLRSAALGRTPSATANARGMALFMRDGMSAWMQAWRSCAVAPRERGCDARAARSAMPAEMVAVLAQMALAAACEVRT